MRADVYGPLNWHAELASQCRIVEILAYRRLNLAGCPNVWPAVPIAWIVASVSGLCLLQEHKQQDEGRKQKAEIEQPLHIPILLDLRSRLKFVLGCASILAAG